MTNTDNEWSRDTVYQIQNPNIPTESILHPFIHKLCHRAVHDHGREPGICGSVLDSKRARALHKMNALHLYRLTSVPEPQREEAPRQTKRAKAPEQTAQTVEYTCLKCGGPVHLASDDPIHCPSCSCRIVRKVFDKTSVPRVYSAV